MPSYQYRIVTPPAPLFTDHYSGFVDADTPELALELAVKKCEAWMVDFCEIREPNEKNKLLIKGYCYKKEVQEISYPKRKL